MMGVLTRAMTGSRTGVNLPTMMPAMMTPILGAMMGLIIGTRTEPENGVRPWFSVGFGTVLRMDSDF
jgi:hypothetical protein